VIYSAQWEGRRPEVFESRTDGSSTSPLPGLSGFGLFSVASNRELAVGERINAISMAEYGPLKVWSPSGSAPQLRLNDIRWAEFMPDGRLAVVRREGGEDLLEIPEGHVVNRTSGHFCDLRVSRDGQRWAFTEHLSFDDSRGKVGLVEGGRPTMLTEEFANVSGLAWSPDGREIWFSAVDYGIRQRLYAVTPNSGRPPRVVHDLPTYVRLMDIDQSGRVLVTSRYTRMGIRGQLVNDTQEHDVGWLDYSWPSALSKDGRKLLLTDQGESSSLSYRVFLREAGDTAPVPLGDGSACALSPDGQWALAIRLDSPKHLVLLPTGAGKPRHLPSGPVETFQNAAFLSDGARIVFVGAERKRADRIWTQAISGGPPSALTDEGIAGVTVSPDDRFIAAVTHDRRLMIVPLDGSRPKDVGPLGPRDTPCQWRDERTLYITRTAPTLELFSVDVQTGQQLPWRKKFEVADPAGITYWNVVTTRDARFYAYSYIRGLDELYVVDGLK
jgi:dipeptidyl aminopeptidase/acylaminoacyl peptidase